jgi:hypothetical protein
MHEYTIMNAGNFDRHVTICLPDSPRPLTVSSASEAASVLADKWPVTYGRSYQHALAMCAAVAEGQIKPEEARSAFLSAASEAGVRTDSETTAAILISPDKLAQSKPIVIRPGEQRGWTFQGGGTRVPRRTF